MTNTPSDLTDTVTMHRRDAIKLSALGLLGASLPRLNGAPATLRNENHRARIACTTASFRDEFSKSLTLNDAAAYFDDELGIKNVEIIAIHFQDSSPRALATLRHSAERRGSRIINIQLDGPRYDLSSPDQQARAASIELVKQWMDKAALLGCSSLRANTGGGERFDLQTTADSFRRLADHGETIGVKILVENHGGYSLVVDNILAIIAAVQSPFCQSLPDFGNVPDSFSQSEREAFIGKMIPSAHLISAKIKHFDENRVHQLYDIGSLVRMSEANGFTGIYSLEQHSREPLGMDRLTACRMVVDIIEKNLAKRV